MKKDEVLIDIGGVGPSGVAIMSVETSEESIEEAGLKGVKSGMKMVYPDGDIYIIVGVDAFGDLCVESSTEGERGYIDPAFVAKAVKAGIIKIIKIE